MTFEKSWLPPCCVRCCRDHSPEVQNWNARWIGGGGFLRTHPGAFEGLRSSLCDGSVVVPEPLRVWMLLAERLGIHQVKQKEREGGRQGGGLLSSSRSSECAVVHRHTRVLNFILKAPTSASLGPLPPLLPAACPPVIPREPLKLCKRNYMTHTHTQASLSSFTRRSTAHLSVITSDHPAGNFDSFAGIAFSFIPLSLPC